MDYWTMGQNATIVSMRCSPMRGTDIPCAYIHSRFAVGQLQQIVEALSKSSTISHWVRTMTKCLTIGCHHGLRKLLERWRLRWLIRPVSVKRCLRDMANTWVGFYYESNAPAVHDTTLLAAVTICQIQARISGTLSHGNVESSDERLN